MVLKKKKASKKRIKRRVIKRKVLRRKPSKKKAVKKKPVLKKSKENIIGKVTHYFPHVRAAVVKLKASLAVGETVKIKGHTTDFVQNVTSLQIDRVPITKAKKGDEIGLLVDSRVRQHDAVYKVK
jgi:putative protease